MSLLWIAFAALCAWVYLALMHGRYWRADQRLNDAPAPARWPEIVAVIPARDEADSIGEVIAAHMKSDYAGKFSVILVDDQSADGTAEIAQRAAAHSDRDLHIVRSADLPAGWSGKLWAVRQGLEQAQEIAPEAGYVLLTDADIVLARDTLSRLAAKAEAENLALASLMARLDSRGWGALLIPAFVYFFQKLYPFPRVNDPDDNMAAAAGGVMLIKTGALEKAGGVEPIKNELIDDCALARRIKDLSPTTKIWLGLAHDEAVSLRDNRSLSSVWNMVARTAYAQLGYSPLLLAGTILGMAFLYLAAPLIFLTLSWHWSFNAAGFALAAWALMAFTYWPTVKLYDRPPWEAALLPLAGALYTGMTVSSALRHWRGAGGQWKGRTY